MQTLLAFLALGAALVLCHKAAGRTTRSVPARREPRQVPLASAAALPDPLVSRIYHQGLHHPSYN